MGIVCSPLEANRRSLCGSRGGARRAPCGRQQLRHSCPLGLVTGKWSPSCRVLFCPGHCLTSFRGLPLRQRQPISRIWPARCVVPRGAHLLRHQTRSAPSPTRPIQLPAVDYPTRSCLGLHNGLRRDPPSGVQAGWHPKPAHLLGCGLRPACPIAGSGKRAPSGRRSLTPGTARPGGAAGARACQSARSARCTAAAGRAPAPRQGCVQGTRRWDNPPRRRSRPLPSRPAP
jgi:hypothetical protein